MKVVYWLINILKVFFIIFRSVLVYRINDKVRDGGFLFVEGLVW